MDADFTILVNSTDSFEDCWYPFFKLFDTYWPNCKYQIVLNTEYKDFSYPGLNIRCSKVGVNSNAKKLPWGWCLSRCLDQIKTDVILYLQEDYFLEGNVDTEMIRKFVNYMVSPNPTHQECGHIGLTYFGSHGPFSVTEHPLLWEVGSGAAYRLCLQAGLWKTDFLRSFVRDKDNGWSFEEQGIYRSNRAEERIMTVNRQEFNAESKLIFPYTHTGIIRGKWNRAAVETLFKNHGINVDFSIRGFLDESKPDPKKAGHDNLPKRVLKRFANKLEMQKKLCIRRTNEWIDRIRSL